MDNKWISNVMMLLDLTFIYCGYFQYKYGFVHRGGFCLFTGMCFLCGTASKLTRFVERWTISASLSVAVVETPFARVSALSPSVSGVCQCWYSAVSRLLYSWEYNWCCCRCKEICDVSLYCYSYLSSVALLLNRFSHHRCVWINCFIPLNSWHVCSDQEVP